MSMLAAFVHLALQAAAPAAGPPPDYYASGSEPFWGLEVRGRGIKFMPNDGSEGSGGIAASLPRRQPVRNGYRLVTPLFTVTVRNIVCEDEAERRYRDSVRVTTRDRHYDGCGGTLLPPAMLERSDWRIETISNMRVDGDNYVLGFNEGRISGHAGCNRFSGPFTQRGAVLTAGPIAATRMLCPGLRMTHERAVLELLRGPVRISYPAGDVMMLTGRVGTIRLRRV